MKMVLFSFLLSCCSLLVSAQQPVDYVNPFIGTSNYGTTNPGAICPQGNKVFTIFRSQQLHLSGLEHPRTDQLHETNGHFMDIRILFHIDHTVQVIQITLPTSVQISQTAPIAVQQGVRSSGHIAFGRW